MRRTALIMLGWALLGVSVTAQAGDRVVARVGSVPITRLEVLGVQSENSGLTYQQALNMLIDHNLALAWARDKGLRVSEQEVDDIVSSIRKRNSLTEEQFKEALAKQGSDMTSFRSRISDQVLVSQATSAALTDRIKPDSEELQRAYLERYPPKETVTVRHILLTVPKGDEGPEAQARRQEAILLLDRIRSGEPFDQVARERSEDPSSAARGGDLGTFSAAELLPALRGAAADLAVGEAGGPVRTDLGYHLLQVTDRKTEPPPPLESVREELSRQLTSDRREEVRRRWLEELRQEYFVEVFPEG